MSGEGFDLFQFHEGPIKTYIVMFDVLHYHVSIP